ncbi:MAG: RHS repeat-associated core domain-containing protein [Bacteroidales bacterium]|nr:RHS repeat-associated core domain-containing protein [Bacteroidales bacterium]
MIDRETGGDTVIRYQLADHLGSSTIELDDKSDIISYEEYHPFGTTSYQKHNTTISQKRYKYTGKERDNETGLYYYGARYYAAWICRFVSVDPLAGKYLEWSPYVYCADNPIKYIDPDGREPRWGQLANLGEILRAVQVGLANFQGVAPNYHWLTRVFNTQADLNRWSQQSMIRQQFNALATHFEGNRRFKYNHSTGGFDETSPSSANVDRYIYTEKQGWIDMHHFFKFAAFAIYDVDEIPNATIGSYVSEAIQDYYKDNASGFSYEDLVSNKIGFEFGLKYGDAILAGKITIESALIEYMNSLEAVEPEQAPNFDFIPYAATNDNRNTKFDGNPLIGIELRNAARNVYNRKAKVEEEQVMSEQQKIDKAHEQIGR